MPATFAALRAVPRSTASVAAGGTIDAMIPIMHADRLAEVPTASCPCGAAGHRILAAAEAGLVSNDDVRSTRPVRSRMATLGLLDVVEAEQGSWERGMWTAELTPAGRFHLAEISGRAGTHVGGCGAALDVDGSCTGCRQRIAMTTGEAARRVAALDPGPRRDAEAWASAFSCFRHGRATAAMVSTAKTCTICGDGLIRHLVPAADPAGA